MAGLCAEDNIAMTPYSALASGRLSRKPGETSARLEQDSYAKFKYDATKEQDEVIIRRVAELADKRGVTMTEVSLAWLLTKVAAPVVGATKPRHIEGATKAVELKLTDEEIACIRWHMGAFDEKENWKHYSYAVSQYPNVLYTHTADMIASQIHNI